MSDTETPRYRSNAQSPVPSEPPKRRSKGKSGPKRAKTPERQFPFQEQDEPYTNIVIKVGEKRLYTNDCILAYFSPELKADFQNDSSGGKGKGKQSGSATKEIDWSNKDYEDVCDFLAFVDPRVEDDVTDETAFRLLPLAKELKVRPLEKVCEKTITHSFDVKRKSRRADMETVLRHLEAADKYDLTDLRQMCISSCMRTTDNRYITDSSRISDKTKVEILSRKLDISKRRVAKESMKLENEKATSRLSDRR